MKTPEDNLIVNVECLICCQQSKATVHWVGQYCHNCKQTFDPFEITAPEIVRKRRELLGKQRRQMAKLTGLKISTISCYENRFATKPYMRLTETLIKKLFKNG